MERGTNVVAKVVFNERKVVLVEGVLTKAKVATFSKRDFKTKLCSFVEVVSSLKKRGKEEGGEEKENVESMSWVGRRGNVDWLERSDVGVLKTFSSLSSMKNRLSSRGYIFYSTFLEL